MDGVSPNVTPKKRRRAYDSSRDEIMSLRDAEGEEVTAAMEMMMRDPKNSTGSLAVEPVDDGSTLGILGTNVDDGVNDNVIVELVEKSRREKVRPIRRP